MRCVKVGRASAGLVDSPFETSAETGALVTPRLHVHECEPGESRVPEPSRRPRLRSRPLTAVAASVLLAFFSLALSPAAMAQDLDLIVNDLEDDGFYIEPGGDGDTSDFQALVRETAGADDEWYFVSMAGPVEADFADSLRDRVRPTGNVLVYFFDNDDFLNVQLASNESETIEDQALISFDRDDWVTPDEFMDDVVRDFDRLTVTTSTSSGTTTTGGSATGSGTASGSDDGGGSVWPWFVGIGAAIGGGVWWSGRRKKKKAAEDQLEAAEKIRAELQTELDELANDVIVLSGPVDLSENETAIGYYREATATYTSISDEIPDLDELANADLRALSELGARVVQARWQMDAAEAIIGGDPIPEKPEIEPPPPPPEQAKAPTPSPAPRIPPQIQHRQPRPRTPYSRSRRSSGGGLLDILIAGSGMLGGRRGGGTFGRSSRGGRSGGMFGGGSSYNPGPARSRNTSRSRGSSPRSGGGVFGGGSSSRGSARRSTSRSRTRQGSSSRNRSRASSTRRSSSRRRRR